MDKKPIAIPLAMKNAMARDREDRQARERLDRFLSQIETPKPVNKRQEKAEKKALAAAERRRLAEQEEKELDQMLMKARRNPPKVTEAELQRRREEERAQLRRRVEEEEKRRSRRTISEEEYTKMVSVVNNNRNRSVIEASTVDGAIEKMTTSMNDEYLTLDLFPERRLNKSFKVFEEVELKRLKEEKPGLTLSKYQIMIDKLWKKYTAKILNERAQILSAFNNNA